MFATWTSEDDRGLVTGGLAGEPQAEDCLPGVGDGLDPRGRGTKGVGPATAAAGRGRGSARRRPTSPRRRNLPRSEAGPSSPARPQAPRRGRACRPAPPAVPATQPWPQPRPRPRPRSQPWPGCEAASLPHPRTAGGPRPAASDGTAGAMAAEQQQFYLLLGNLLSPDNVVRKQAEETYENIPGQSKITFLLEAIRNTTAAEEETYENIPGQSKITFLLEAIRNTTAAEEETYENIPGQSKITFLLEAIRNTTAAEEWINDLENDDWCITWPTSCQKTSEANISWKYTFHKAQFS
ncbi:uncharacterized protein [Symphalangus syndactylus]|uniref:uncharacterized protein n=1 Tax=Symphalangus syndactylus TaxID=9590 RepID=UPI0030041567